MGIDICTDLNHMSITSILIYNHSCLNVPWNNSTKNVELLTEDNCNIKPCVILIAILLCFCICLVNHFKFPSLEYRVMREDWCCLEDIEHCNHLQFATCDITPTPLALTHVPCAFTDAL